MPAISDIQNFNDPDWATANVYFRRTDGKVDGRVEIINTKTLQRYNHEETCDTVTKGVILATLGIPAYTIANLAGHVIRAVTLVFSLFYKCIANFFTEGNPLVALKKLIINLTYQLPKILLVTIWAVVKAPICAIAMEFCAIGVIASPLDWRVKLGDVERFWRGTDRKNHMTEGKGNAVQEKITDFFTNVDSPNGFFLAYCFQPWGSLNDPHIIDYGFLPPSDRSQDPHAQGHHSAAAAHARMTALLAAEALADQPPPPPAEDDEASG